MCEKGGVLPRESRRLTERPTERPPPRLRPNTPTPALSHRLARGAAAAAGPLAVRVGGVEAICRQASGGGRARSRRSCAAQRIHRDPQAPHPKATTEQRQTAPPTHWRSGCPPPPSPTHLRSGASRARRFATALKLVLFLSAPSSCGMASCSDAVIFLGASPERRCAWSWLRYLETNRRCSGVSRSPRYAPWKTHCAAGAPSGGRRRRGGWALRCAAMPRHPCMDRCCTLPATMELGFGLGICLLVARPSSAGRGGNR